MGHKVYKQIEEYKNYQDSIIINESYNKIDDDNMKADILNKVVKLPGFILSDKMINDIIKLKSTDCKEIETKLVNIICANYNVQNDSTELTQIKEAIEKFKGDCDNEKLYETYNGCKSMNTRKMILVNVIGLKFFRPNKVMIRDIINLDFSESSPLEIRLLKGVFSGVY